MSRSRSGTQAGFSSATVITTSPSTSSSRSSSPTAVSHDVKQVGVDVLAALLVTCLVGRRDLSRCTYHSEARSTTPAMRLGQRRLSSRWNRRGASRRTASGSFNAPQSKTDGRTVCPSSPAASSHGACPRRRDRQAQFDDHGGLQQRQVLNLVDDDAVEIGCSRWPSTSDPTRWPACFPELAAATAAVGRLRDGELPEGFASSISCCENGK